MLDHANEVSKLQGRLVLSTFRQKSYSSIVSNAQHNGVVHHRVASTCSCEHGRARLPLIEAVRFAENETSVRIFLRIQLQTLTRFSKSLPYKS